MIDKGKGEGHLHRNNNAALFQLRVSVANQKIYSVYDVYGVDIFAGNNAKVGARLLSGCFEAVLFHLSELQKNVYKASNLSLVLSF